MQTVSRLIDQFVPTHYNLALHIDRPGRTFDGTVTIEGSLVPGASAIRLHAKDLVIESAMIDSLAATVTAGENDEQSLAVDGLVAGDHSVVVRFSGKITDGMHGMYPCYYEHAGVKKELIATQFESHHAREVFPCIDEPAAKATFDVSLTIEEGVVALGNMPVKSQDGDGEHIVTVFETSPRMSTYLLAFVVGELQSKTAKTADGVEVSVWATPAQPAASLDFALDTAVKSIEFYNDYFGTPYPLPKLDNVALPDFSSGAMENWGLVTYREVALLADPATTGISSRQYIATVIAHELAHQWFGNLVTMKWWNDLWLNESFATLMEYLAVDALYPDWNIWLDFASGEVTMALRRDAIDGVQPVQTDVNHPDEINTLFDGAIVYAKGARLLRMLQHFVGDGAFQAGLKAYFEEFAYHNTVASDLWQAITRASGKDIVGLMNTWISQPGYPVLHVTKGSSEIAIRQEQFFVGPHEPSSKQWPIPLGSNLKNAPELLTTESASIIVPLEETATQFNQGSTAHFLTHYDETLLQELTTNLSSLDAVSRLQLLLEATMLARAGVMPSHQLIPLIKAYESETSEHVWNVIAMTLAELRKFIEDNEPAEQKLRALSRQVARSQYERLGWERVEGESEDDTKLRSTIIGLTIYGEDPEAIATAQKYYEVKELSELDPELRPLILSSVARYGTGAVVDDLLAAYKATQSSDLKHDICSGITSTRVPEKIDELCELIKNTSVVKQQDVARWFVYLIRTRDSRTVTWQWMRDNWDWIEKTFSGDKSYDDYPRYSASALVTRAQLDEYREFFEPMLLRPALTRAITMGISEIEGRVALIERDKKGVQDTLIALP